MRSNLIVFILILTIHQRTIFNSYIIKSKFVFLFRISDFFGYNTDNLLEKSVFDYHHAEDSVALRECFKNRKLFSFLFVVSWNFLRFGFRKWARITEVYLTVLIQLDVIQ